MTSNRGRGRVATAGERRLRVFAAACQVVVFTFLTFNTYLPDWLRVVTAVFVPVAAAIGVFQWRRDVESARSRPITNPLAGERTPTEVLDVEGRAGELPTFGQF